MKLKYNEIEAFVKSPQAYAQAILVYGPDEGLVRERMGNFAKHIVADINDPFNVVEITGGTIEDDPSRLIDEAKSISMLGGRRVIRVRDAEDKITTILKEVLKSLTADDALILIEGKNLGSKSSLRALCENAKNAVVIPCYVDDAGTIERLIGEGLKSAGYNISSDARAYMAAGVVGDRAVVRSEIDKLITYTGTETKNITLDDVTACIGNSAALSLEDIAKHVASGQFAAAERILQSVLSEGMSAVAVTRSLQSYFLKLHLVKAHLQKGEPMDSALKKLRPPLFWKTEKDFRLQLQLWEMPRLEQAIFVMAGVEAKCKQTGGDAYTLCSRAILSLTQIASRKRR